MAYTNSSLVSYTRLSPNCTKPRNHTIDRITPHCVVGQLTAKAVLNLKSFVNYSTTEGASCNYVIGTDGAIGMGVEEANRSWCTSNKTNDHRAVTIECASDTKHPYAMNDVVYASLVNLCVDICKRNGKKKLLWLGSKDKTLNYTPKSDEMVLTAHRWFANKDCPGDWLYSRYDRLATEVTEKLIGVTAPTTPPPTKEKKATDPAQSFKASLAGKYKVVAKSGLYLRNGASTSKSAMCVMPNGTTVQNFGYYTQSGGTTWMYVVAVADGVSYTGFCSKKYLAKL